jgi:RNA polymerase sigma-70 factor, ECF subfamily
MSLASVAGGLREMDSARRLDALVADHFSLVWRMFRRLGASAADADDGSQEVFMVAARKLDAIEPGRERSFLLGVAVRVFATQRRTARRRQEEPESEAFVLASSAPDPSEHAELRQARAALDEVLARLPLEQRTVFVLYELEELSVAEIADLLQTPRGTVSWRLKEAREAFSVAARRLRAQLEHPRRPS